MAENKEKIYVCRCEEVSVADIERAIAAGARSITAIKVRTNAGMGVCQGMTCRNNIRRMLERQQVDERYLEPSYRFPVRPVNTGALSAGMAREEEEDDAR